MMTIYENLKQQGIILYSKDKKLKYKAAKGALNSDIKTLIAEHRESLITYINENQIDETAATAAFNLHSIDSMSNVLSFGQQRLWMLQQLEKNSAAYNINTGFEITGALDLTALYSALRYIIRRHEVLRMNVVDLNGSPDAKIEETFTLTEDIVDLSQQPELVVEARAKEIVSKLFSKPFDLHNDMLLRVKVIKLKENVNWVALSIHHIAADGWSIDVLVKELLQLYKGYEEGVEPKFVSPDISYFDFAKWQRSELTGTSLETHVNFWKEALVDIPELHSLPLDKSRPNQIDTLGSSFVASIPDNLLAKIKLFSKEQGLTMFMLLETLLSILFYKYGRSNDIIIGTPVAGRTNKQLEDLIGFFVNTLILRTDVQSGLTCIELMRENKGNILKALQHQHLPFEMLVEELNPARSLSYNPLFQIMFSLQHEKKGEVTFGQGLSLSPINSDSCEVRFDIEIEAYERNNSIDIEWKYQTSLFDASTIENMANNFIKLIELVVLHPDLTIADLPLLRASEEKRLTIDFNPPISCSNDMVVTGIYPYIQSFSKMAPDRIALTCGSEQITYAELDDKVNRLAKAFSKYNPTKDNLIAISLSRSINVVIAMLASWKVGAAYLPLESDLPNERLASILDESNAIILLTELDTHLKLTRDINIMTSNDISEIISLKGECKPITCNLDSDALAYVIYTSGSTGKPKGVMVEHKNLQSFRLAMADKFSKETGRWLASTSVSFDISILELLVSLSYGYEVVLAEVGNNTNGELGYKDKKVEFSLFFFSSDDEEVKDNKYNFLLSAAQYADNNKFEAVWTPERHFGVFGGMYPNPAITSSAIAVTTKNVGIRAGSCVVGLHNPVRVAEDWSVIDNLSGGRVGIAFASGWHPNDFALAPEKFANRKEQLNEDVELIHRLWSGEEVQLKNGVGKSITQRIRPKALQSNLPTWLTIGGNPEGFKYAGQCGYNVLTHLLGQSVSQLQEKIDIYRKAWQEAGHQGEGQVTLMLHTFIDENKDTVLKHAKEPFKNYLNEALDLIKSEVEGLGKQSGEYSEQDIEALKEHAFNRYHRDSALIGTPEECLKLVDQLKGIGVNEIACLIDFGVPSEVALNGLEQVNKLRVMSLPQQYNAPKNVIELLRTERITHFQTTPSLLSVILSEKDADSLIGGLDHLLVGGEALPLSIYQQLQKMDHVSCYNVYGPTETTIWSSSEKITEGQEVLIGRPLSNNRFYVVDEHLCLVPEGAVGELLIGGESVVRGYLSQEALTASKFIEVNFTGSRERVYRTGDLVRYRNNGNLAYIGRADDQVKVRGYRIELGEIESVLISLPYVSSAAVVVNKRTSLDKFLIAYIVLHENDEHEKLLEEVKRHLARQLPHYMVPNVIKVISSIPLTSSGKLNRHALPKIHEDIVDSYIAPSSETQHALCRIWQELLKIEKVGIRDNFFELGGHSLLVGRTVSEIREELGCEITIRQMFEEPTIEALASAIDSNKKNVVIPPIVKRSHSEYIPMSYAQQRLWFIDSLEGGSPQYNIPAFLRLSGLLQPIAFENAISTIIERHESLRTTFYETESDAYQVINEEFILPIERVDLSNLSEEEQEQKVSELSGGDAFKLFDLRHELPIRVSLLKLSDSSHVVLFNMHHIASDGWSMGILIEEFNRLYSAYSQGQPNPLVPLSVQYADYAHWQRAWLQGDVLVAQLSYWSGQLSGLPQVHNLPLDKARPIYQQFEAASHDQIISSDLSERVYAFCQSHDVTLFMFLQTAYSVLLGRYSNETDIVIGAPIAGRTHKDTEGLIGFFVNSLVLRTDLSQSTSFEDLLQCNKQMILDAYDHQHVPFEMLVDELQPERSLAYSPLFQVTMTLHNQAKAVLDIDSLEHDARNSDDKIIRFDMELVVVESNDGILLRLRYKDSLFSAESIERMLSNYVHLITRVLDAPDTSIQSLPLVSQEEEELRASWQSNEQPYSLGHCLHEVFESQTTLTPQAMAVRCGEQSLSYQSLNERSNQLARHLLTLGLSPGSCIGLCVERSVDMMVGLLGILKSGYAYVPLEPNHPTERLAYQLSDCAIDVVVSHRGLSSKLPLDGQRVVLLDKNSLNTYDTGDLDREQTGISPSSLAYVIYTSGSTGHPKGTLVGHDNVMNFLYFAEQHFMQEAVVGSVVSSPIAFDATVQSLYVPLLSGRYVEFLEEDILPIESLSDYLFDEEDVLLFKITPSHLKAVEESGLVRRNEWVKHVLVVAGELLNSSLLSRWQAYLPNACFINEYGPTEATVGSTIYDITSSEQATFNGGVPIGRPIGNATCHVLDAQGQHQPIGVPGELYIGGSGVCQGYLNTPQLTEAKFVELPSLGTGRYYRTGDLVKWDNQGQLCFIGRIDNQIKLRGFRVELGEIESSLERHEGIEKAVVLLRDEQLVGYVLADQGTAYPVRALSTLESEGHNVQTMSLPNGMVVGCLNEGETRYTYEEIFEQEAYLSCGIQLGRGATVLDVGANTGMFSLYVGQRCPDVKLYSFEPIPSVYEVLSFNARLYGLDIQLFSQGVGDKSGEVEFTYYPNNSLISSRYGDQEEEIADVKRYLRMEHQEALRSGELTEAGLDELLRARLESEQVQCDIVRLHDVIAEQGLECIDLLKVDVQKSEVDVLEGLEAQDWAKIQQVIIEVHDIGGRVSALCEVLSLHGFESHCISPNEGETGPHQMVYGIKPDYDVEDVLRANTSTYRWCDGQVLLDDAKRDLRHCLADYMVPERYVLLDNFVLSGNGKVDRKGLPDPDTLGVSSHDYVAPRNEQERLLCTLWAQVLKLDSVGIDDNFYAIGGDSIISIQLVARARQQGIQFTVRQLFDCQTVRELAAVAIQQTGLLEPEERCYGEFVMQPAQKVFFEKQYAEPSHYNQSVLLNVKHSFSEQEIITLSQALYEKHDALRLRFADAREKAKAWFKKSEQHDVDKMYDYVDISSDTPVTDKIEQYCAEAQSSLNLTEGPLFRLLYMKLSGRNDRLFVISHHLLVDGVSWRILLRDIQVAFSQLIKKQGVILTDKTNSLQQWARSLSKYVLKDDVLSQESYWVSQLEADNKSLKSYLGKEDSIREWTLQLNNDLTSDLLTGCNQAFNTKINELLIAAWVYSLRAPVGDNLIGLLMESHGREDIDDRITLSETIGWFTAEFPLAIDIRNIESLAKLIKYVKESVRSVPNNGVGFGLLQHFSGSETLTPNCQLDNLIKFNYLGRMDSDIEFDGPIRLATEKTGDSVAETNIALGMPSLNIWVVDGKLTISIAGSVTDPIGESLLRKFKESIVEVADCCNAIIARSKLKNTKFNEEQKQSLLETSFDI